MNNPQSLVFQKQAPLRVSYREQPEKALTCKRARTAHRRDADALHGTVVPGDYGVSWPFGIDRAVGGLHDAPNPAEMLCAALAACQDSSIRMVADLTGVELHELTVEVTGTVDVRGSLMVDRAVPVGFESMECRVTLRAAPGTPPDLIRKLLAQAEHSCINMATLRSGIGIRLELDDGAEPATARSTAPVFGTTGS